jgi:hypothetical protein
MLRPGARKQYGAGARKQYGAGNVMDTEAKGQRTQTTTVAPAKIAKVCIHNPCVAAVFTVGIPTLPSPQAHVTPRRLCSGFSSGLPTLFMRRGPVKTHLTGYRQLLTRGPKGCHPPTAAKGPESVPTVHSQSLPGRTHPQTVVPVCLSACKMPRCRDVVCVVLAGDGDAGEGRDHVHTHIERSEMQRTFALSKLLKFVGDRQSFLVIGSPNNSLPNPIQFHHLLISLFFEIQVLNSIKNE